LIERQRIDKWLWHSRLVRTRSAAAGLAMSGHVRVNGARVKAPSRLLRIGDVVTVSLYQGVRILRVVGFSGRRGSGGDARLLFEELGGNSNGGDEEGQERRAIAE
jgi:ribosome-associated heat shock protein Hsp15